MSIEPAAQKPCSECTGLRNGTRSNQDPHEYLLLANRSDADASASYRCLLCKSELVREGDGPLARWK